MSAAYAVQSGATAAKSVTATPVTPRAHRGSSPAAPRTHLRLTRRGRVVFTTLGAVPLVVGSLALALNGGVAAAGDISRVSATEAFDYVTIEAGQSLWQLAESVAPHQDPRDVIADIVNLNQLASEAVQPGQRLALPADY